MQIVYFIFLLIVLEIFRKLHNDPMLLNNASLRA